MTVFAPATAPGKAAIGVVRVSGPMAGAVVAAVAGDLPPARRAARRRLRDPESGEVLDEAIVLWFPGPGSYTGEDVAEFHLHGSRAVIAAVLGMLAKWPGLRPAEPGEFTRRAFENGKIDLTAAEGLADLVAAQTDCQRRQALRQLDGELGRLYEGWRAVLTRGLAFLEAAIDFPEEGLPENPIDPVWDQIRSVESEIHQHLDDCGRGERLRDGLSAVIVGAPNVGKSSLLNCLVRRDAVIVADTAGTTRDVVEVGLDLDGFPLTVADTAGLRCAGDGVEEEGIRRARKRAGDADLVIGVFDATRWPEREADTEELLGGDGLVVWNKVDLAAVNGGEGVWPLSCRTGEGVDLFVAGLSAAVRDRLDPSASPVLTRARHRAALVACAQALERALGVSAVELAGEDLRAAVAALGRITGRVDVEELLDVIFQELCIGK